MKKLGILFAAITMCMFVATVANAGLDFSSNAGAAITITATTNVPGSDPMIFNPSPKVNMTGSSNAIGFAVNAVHASAIGTEGGKAYGMAADQNRIFFSSAKATDFTLPVITTGHSTTFANWTTMQ